MQRGLFMILPMLVSLFVLIGTADVTSAQGVNFVSKAGAFCADVEGEKYANGTAIIAWPCGPKQNQRFVRFDDDTIRPEGHYGYCLDLNMGTSMVTLWSCKGVLNQKWELVDQGGGIGTAIISRAMSGGKGAVIPNEWNFWSNGVFRQTLKMRMDTIDLKDPNDLWYFSRMENVSAAGKTIVKSGTLLLGSGGLNSGAHVVANGGNNLVGLNGSNAVPKTPASLISKDGGSLRPRN